MHSIDTHEIKENHKLIDYNELIKFKDFIDKLYLSGRITHTNLNMYLI